MEERKERRLSFILYMIFCVVDRVFSLMVGLNDICWYLGNWVIGSWFLWLFWFDKRVIIVDLVWDDGNFDIWKEYMRILREEMRFMFLLIRWEERLRIVILDYFFFFLSWVLLGILIGEIIMGFLDWNFFYWSVENDGLK